MSLDELISQFIACRSPSKRYLESLRRTVRQAARYGLGEVCQLSDLAVNEFLGKLPYSAAETVANVRREICTLWRFANEIGAIDSLPTRVRRVKIARAPARAWAREDLVRMLDAARNDEARISSRVPVRVCDVLPAWIVVGYETGLRFSDVLNLHARHLHNGSVVMSENKTGKPCVCRLTPECVLELQRLGEHSPDGSFFKWCLPRRRAFAVWRAFLNRHRFSGSARWLRRSAATYIEKDNAGGATTFLRHSAPHLARIHYIDTTLLNPPPCPPPLMAG